ncbi:tetratricopeptide repeat protein [Roseateles sp. BYS87W]|uniref:Tol-pal system YbgF family protein n=1 Tax=Pelomonas baiyunensis TaxID=3299026 RepID=A0ABW7H1V5_9BURK
MAQAPAHAQVLDDVEARREGANAVVTVRFAAPVQLVRTVSARSGDLAQVYYDVLATGDAPNLVTSERRVPLAQGGFLVLLTDEAAGTTERSRKLVLRFGAATQFTARPGQNNRSIELVLANQAAALTPAAPNPLPAPVAAEPAARPLTDAERERSRTALAAARQLIDQGEHGQALERLDEVLALPPHEGRIDALELRATARWRQGDPDGARADYERYLVLYPQGPGAARAREALLTLAPPAPSVVEAAIQAGRDPARAAATTTLAGSLAVMYYGGQSKVRTQEFQDSPLGGLPQLVNDATLSGTDQRQLLSSVDVNWRRRDADSDLRLVLRDTKTNDLMRPEKNRNKLTALYVDYKLTAPGAQLRLGRQSPTGGGVMGRFDGVQAGYRFAPRWRVNAVAGAPTDPLLDTKRRFWGVSLDADEIAKGFGGSLYWIQQTVDGQSDRRGVGAELRMLAGPFTALGSLDYDPQLKGWNIVSTQSTWQGADNTIVNVLYDRRATPMLMLGNALFFQNPVAQVQARTLYELLLTQSLPMLRQQVRGTTAFSTQAMVSVSRPITPHWQAGADVRLTNVGALPPVADILPNGQPGTGNVWSMGAQLIGTNLYSARDTHVVLLTLLRGPTYHGELLSYNNASAVGEGWLLEPSLRLYQQTEDSGLRTRRWAPGLRASKRLMTRWVAESELSMEFSNAKSATRNESSHRTFYYAGLRYDL